jgi:hypothetical protein
MVRVMAAQHAQHGVGWEGAKRVRLSGRELPPLRRQVAGKAWTCGKHEWHGMVSSKHFQHRTANSHRCTHGFWDIR